MAFIKYLLFFWLIPVVTWSQTVHVDSNKIVYKGSVKLAHIHKEELYGRAKNALLNNVKGSKEMFVADKSEKEKISAKGSIRLASPYHIIKIIEYIFELSVDDEKYEYRIDSVYIKQVERGGKPIKISGEELLKSMDVSGPVSANAEKQLNEIDMNFQKLIALVNAEMKKPTTIKNAE